MIVNRNHLLRIGCDRLDDREIDSRRCFRFPQAGGGSIRKKRCMAVALQLFECFAGNLVRKGVRMYINNHILISQNNSCRK